MPKKYDTRLKMIIIRIRYHCNIDWNHIHKIKSLNQCKKQGKFFIFGPECTIPLEGHEDP